MTLNCNAMKGFLYAKSTAVDVGGITQFCAGKYFFNANVSG